MAYNILIVEDEYLNAKFLEQIILDAGHHVVEMVTSANEAIEVVKANKIDLVFMDINLDGSIDGIRCASLLNQYYEVAVIYVSAYGDTDTILEASETNIYGYLVKPFDTSDVIAALNVAFKMLSNRKTVAPLNDDSSTLQFSNDYLYNYATKTLSISGVCVELTNKETLLLHLFCSNLNQNVSYELLLEDVWKGYSVSNSTIRDTISRLRKKAPLLQFENIASVGYRLIKE